MVRSTTNGVLKSYRYNLQCSTYTLNNARNTVLTGRAFNTFADDPATAARCFQLRRSFERVNSQYSVGQSVVRKYEVAWSTLNSVVDDVNNARAAIIRGSSDPTASGRNALGQELQQFAEGIVQAMNTKYGDNFVFAGADGMEVPFSLENGTLYYRGINVSTTANFVLGPDGSIKSIDIDGVSYAADAGGDAILDADGNKVTLADAKATKAALDALNYMANDEKKFADIGLGLEENENGELIESSAFNVALQGITYLGYGTDEDGDPKNIVCIASKLGEILQRCDENGNFSEDDQEDFDRLFSKFETAASTLTNKYTELDARATFLKSNQEQLENNAYTLQEQFLEMENVDEAEAITAYSWAQYCYNAALKVGNSILSQSLMDYLNT